MTTPEKKKKKTLGGKKRRIDDILDLMYDDDDDAAAEADEEEEEEEELQAQALVDPSLSFDNNDENDDEEDDDEDPPDPRMKLALDVVSRVDAAWEQLPPFDSTEKVEIACRRMNVPRATEISFLKTHVKRLERSFEPGSYGEDEVEKGKAAAYMLTLDDQGSLERVADRVASPTGFVTGGPHFMLKAFDNEERQPVLDKLRDRRDAKKRIRLLELDSALDTLGGREHLINPNKPLDFSPPERPRGERCLELEYEFEDLEEWFRFARRMGTDALARAVHRRIEACGNAEHLEHYLTRDHVPVVGVGKDGEVRPFRKHVLKRLRSIEKKTPGKKKKTTRDDIDGSVYQTFYENYSRHCHCKVPCHCNVHEGFPSPNFVW